MAKADGSCECTAWRLDAEEAPTARIPLHGFRLSGDWRVGVEFASLSGTSGSVAGRFRSRDVSLFMATSPGGRPVRFRVRVDGAAPGREHGLDRDHGGWGRLDEARSYQLFRQSPPIADRTLEIAFFGAGAPHLRPHLRLATTNTTQGAS